MRALRFILVAMICLSIGFVAGWQLKRHDLLSPAAPLSAPANSLVRPTSDNQQIKAAPKTRNPAASAETFLSGSPSLSERLSMLRWLKTNGVLFSVQIFDADHKISSQMALFYGLTPQETEQLEHASQQAEQRLEALHKQHAQLDPTSSPEKLIVTIPAFPDEGGKVYNDLFASFSDVLGKERYAVFNEISGDQLESAFENFGTARTRYEVSVLATGDGKQFYNVARSYVFDAVDYRSGMGGWTTSGSSNSTLDLRGVTKSYPLLRSFNLPTVLSQKPR